jgi:hypothetical protein
MSSLPPVTRLAAVHAAADQGLLVMDEHGAIVVLSPQGAPIGDASGVVNEQSELFDLVEVGGVIRIIVKPLTS